jgi:DNA-directed RNA polymerase specialized sigma24 family protein
MTHRPEVRPEDSGGTSSVSQEHSDALDAFFLRYRRVLYGVAYRVLSNHKDAEDAVQNLFLSMSHNIPRFECEGSFRSWLLRGLIDEALAILHKNRIRPPAWGKPIHDPRRFLSRSDPTCGGAPASPAR